MSISAIEVLPTNATTDHVHEFTIEIIMFGGFGLLCWVLGKKYEEKKERVDKVDELYQVVNGLEGNSNVKGIVDIIESHDEEIDDNNDRIEELQTKMDEAKSEREEISSRIERLRKKCESRSDAS